MTIVEEINSIWSDSNTKDLGTVLQNLLDLLDKAYNSNEEIPSNLELEILLHANYALGFGGQPSETRRLAILYDKILSKLVSSTLSDLNIRSDYFHRLACTIAGGVLSIISSDEYQNTSTAYDIISWKNYDQDNTVLDLLNSLRKHLILGINHGKLNSWKLELLTFIMTLHLIVQDLDGEGNSQDDITTLTKFADSIDKTSDLWVKWQTSWLEYSDYYRFVTLMITNTSSPEEIWFDEIKSIVYISEDEE